MSSSSKDWDFWDVRNGVLIRCSCQDSVVGL